MTTLSQLREWVAGLAHLHPLTPVNVESVQGSSSGVCFSFDESDTEAALLEAREELKDANAEAKEASAEAEELRETVALMAGDPMDDAARIEEIERFRFTAKYYAGRCEKAERELTALRKRKGIDAAYFAMRNDLLAFIHNSNTPEAKALVNRYHQLK